MPAIWTDADGRVTRIYHDETELTDEQLQDATIVDSIPDDSADVYEQARLYYSDSNGLHYQYTDLMSDLSTSFSDSEKASLVEAIDGRDYQTVCDLINNHI